MRLFALTMLLLLVPLVASAENPSDSHEVANPPKSNWQVPGEIQQPKGTWQVPGELQVPRGIQAITRQDATSCESRLSVAADALFEFDKADLSTQAKVTLEALVPIIADKKPRSVTLEGHTDSKGSQSYNFILSTRRAAAVQTWLQKQHVTTGPISTTGYGDSRPVASNTTSDGKDDPLGRQKNRRVEIVLATCD